METYQITVIMISFRTSRGAMIGPNVGFTVLTTSQTAAAAEEYSGSSIGGQDQGVICMQDQSMKT